MALGDGITWDETLPTDATLATLIDDHFRDLRIGTRSRLALEHEWPASQASTAAAGQHKFITLQNQAAKPTVSGTQSAAVYTKTVGSGLQELFFEDEAGTEVQLTAGTGVVAPSGAVIKIASTQNAAYDSAAGTVAFDDSIPQITEGKEILTISYAAAASGNTLVFVVTAPISCGISQNGAMSLYQGTTADAIAVTPFSDDSGNFPRANTLEHSLTVATTASITYSVRIGNASGTSYLNGVSAGRKYGGKSVAQLTIYEAKA